MKIGSQKPLHLINRFINLRPCLTNKTLFDMRYTDRDAMSFKIYRKDSDRIYPYRVKGCNVCRFLPIYLPEHGTAEYMIVPGEKAYRKNGYWLSLSFNDGDLVGGEVSMVRNFLPIGAWPTFVRGRDVFEKIENAWAEFKDMTVPGIEYNFKDVKLEELTERGQTEWVDFLRMRDACIVHLTNMSIEYIDDSPELSTEISECIRKFEAACDKYEREHFGDIEFADPCPYKELRRFQ